METQFVISDNIQRPDRTNSTFPFRDIPVGGGLVVTPTGNEELEKVASKVRNAVASFKKSNKDFVLTTSIHEDHVVVYRDAAKE